MRLACPAICLISAGLFSASTAFGQPQPDPPPTLGLLVRESWDIAAYRIESISADRDLISLRRLKVLKGKRAPQTLEHRFAQLEERDKSSLGHLQTGDLAVYFMGPQEYVCLGDSWYVGFPETHFDKTLAQTYYGSAVLLQDHVTNILQGNEVTITAATPRDKLDLASCCLHTFPASDDTWERLWRIKASVKINRPAFIHDESPYFVGWGIGGPEIVPELINNLSDKRWWIRARAALDLGQLPSPPKNAKRPLRQALADASIPVRICAARALAMISEDDSAAVPVLREALHDKATRIDALLTLALYDARAFSVLPEIVRVMLDANKPMSERIAACWCLSRIVSAPGVPSGVRRDLAASFNEILVRYPFKTDDGDDSGYMVLVALRTLGPDMLPAIPGIRRSFDSPVVMMGLGIPLITGAGIPGLRIYDDLVCSHANEAHLLSAELGMLGFRDNFMIPTYLGFLKSNLPEDRVEAARALLRLDRPLANRVIVPALIGLLQDRKKLRSGSTKEHEIFTVIAELGHTAKPVVPWLVAYLNDVEMTNRTDAIEILGLMGPSAREATPCLHRFLSDRREGIHDNPEVLALISGLSLWRIEGRQEYIQEMSKVIKVNLARHQKLIPTPFHSGDPFEQEPTRIGDYDRQLPNEFELLAQIGRPACQALAHLIESPELQNADLDRQTCAAVALAKLDRRLGLQSEASTAKAVALLEKSMQASSSRQSSAIILSDFGQAGKSAIPVLIEGLGDANLETRIKALRALSSMGPLAGDAVSAIEKLLRLSPEEQLADPDTRSKRHRLALRAVETLHRIEPTHPDILPTLIYYVEKHPNADSLLYEILARLGPSAKGAVPVLSKLARDLYGLEQQVCLRNLAKIDVGAAEQIWKGNRLEMGAPFPPVELSEAEMADAWASLASPNEVLATRAMWQFAFTPKSAIPFLERRVQPDTAVSDDRIRAWIVDLDSNNFQTRETATKQLAAIGEAADPFLKREMEKKPSPESRRRIESLRELCNPEAPPRRRLLRAVEALELCGTSEARMLLQKLATGAADTHLTWAAREALKREKPRK